MSTTISDRFRQRIAALGCSQSEVAASVHLTDSKLLKSLAGTRQFSAVEVAELASELGVTTHWLITGEEDPLGWRLVAGHEFEPVTGQNRAEFLGFFRSNKAIGDDFHLICLYT